MKTATISQQRIQELKSLGFYVENMGAEYGEDFEGQYRWMNDKTGEFQECAPDFSIEAAWIDCDKYATAA